jgi:hypothetical protein
MYHDGSARVKLAKICISPVIGQSGAVLFITVKSPVKAAKLLSSWPFQ